jgi:hypothetical protein
MLCRLRLRILARSGVHAVPPLPVDLPLPEAARLAFAASLRSCARCCSRWRSSVAAGVPATTSSADPIDEAQRWRALRVDALRGGRVRGTDTVSPHARAPPREAGVQELLDDAVAVVA